MAVLGIVGGAQVFSSASGGKTYVYNNIGITPQQVAPGSPSRQKITFHNPGAVDLFIASAVAVDPATGKNVPLSPSNASLGGCWRLFSNGGTLELSGECQVAWQAFAVSGTANPLTIMDTNVS
jgi:hypothetical protein